MFFSSLLSVPFWKHAGPFNMVQLPWRLFCVLDLAVIVMLSQLLDKRLLSLELALPSLGLIVLLGFAVAGSAQYLYYHLGDSPTLMTIKNDGERVALRADASEYLPACLDQSQEEYQAMTYRRISANQLLQPEAGVLPVYYYPFLEVSAEGRVLPITCNTKTGFIRYNTSAIPGSVTVQPKPMPIEKTAWIISLASFLILLAAIAFGFTRSTRKNR